MRQVLNYGQSIFEGMKAQRSAKGRIVLFRPEQNAARMAAGAIRLSMPPPPADLFVGAIEQLVLFPYSPFPQSCICVVCSF